MTMDLQLLFNKYFLSLGNKDAYLLASSGAHVFMRLVYYVSFTFVHSAPNDSTKRLMCVSPSSCLDLSALASRSEQVGGLVEYPMVLERLP